MAPAAISDSSALKEWIIHVETDEEAHGSSPILTDYDEIAAGERTSDNFPAIQNYPLSTVSGLGFPPTLPLVHLPEKNEVLNDEN